MVSQSVYGAPVISPTARIVREKHNDARSDEEANNFSRDRIWGVVRPPCGPCRSLSVDEFDNQQFLSILDNWGGVEMGVPVFGVSES